MNFVFLFFLIYFEIEIDKKEFGAFFSIDHKNYTHKIKNTNLIAVHW